MVKRSDKERVSIYMKGARGTLTTAQLATRLHILHPSTRRILNELRVEGVVQRGGTHGTWIYIDQPEPVAEPVVLAVLDEPTQGPVGNDDPLDIEGREDVDEFLNESDVVLSIFKVEGEGDIVYLEAPSAEDALKAIVDTLGIPAELLKATPVDALPEGEELYVLPTEGDMDPNDVYNPDEPAGN